MSVRVRAWVYMYIHVYVYRLSPLVCVYYVRFFTPICVGVRGLASIVFGFLVFLLWERS